MGEPRPANHFTLAIGGREAAGQFREVTGMDSSIEGVEQRSVDANGKPVIRKVSGNPKFSDITLKRGVDPAADLWAWYKDVVDNGPDAARTDATLTLCNYDGSPIATYTILQAFPLKYTAASMNASSNEVAVEELTLAHEGFERM